MYTRAKTIQVKKSERELGVENMRKRVQNNTPFKHVSQMSLKKLHDYYKRLCY